MSVTNGGPIESGVIAVSHRATSRGAVSNRDGDGKSDGELIARSVADAEAFAAVYDRHAEQVGRYLVRRVAPGQVESLLADVFVAAFEHRHRFDPTRPNALPWLYGIARNLVRHHHRALGRERRATGRLASQVAVDADGAPWFEDRVEAIADANGELDRILTAIGHQAEIDREVLLLYAWEGLTYAEIAEALAIPVGTVRSRLFRIRRKLRSVLP